MAGRYSTEATEKKRLRNFDRWKTKSAVKWGCAFDYTPASTTYKAQKEPVEIKCNKHGQFTTTPAQHLMQKGGGCPGCGKISRSQSRIQLYRDSIRSWIDNELPEHIEILDMVKSAGAEIKVRCLLHNTVKTTTISNLKNSKAHGCEKCARESTLSTRKLTTKKLKELYGSAIPDHIHIIRRCDSYQDFKAEMLCDLHGEFSVNITTLKNGTYLCPECRRRNAGYTSQRLQRLIDEKSRGKPTWLGILHVNVFGIDSLKVGVTIRTLEDRYKWHLKNIFYAVQLDEVTAYTFENLILEKFHDHKDLRILKKGMRDGARWGGDTELLFLRQERKVVEYLKELLKSPTAEFGSAQLAADRMEASRSNVKTDRDKDLSNESKVVIGLNPNSLSIAERFSSIAEAKRAGFPNVSMALSGKRSQTGGLIWITEELFKSTQSDILLKEKQLKVVKQLKYRGTPVLCVEANIHFHSTTEASETLKKLGLVVNPSHITSVCRGNRPHAGGFHWQYSDLTHEQIEAIDQPETIPAPSIKASNSPIRIYAYDEESGDHIGSYNSQTEAAKFLGFSSAGSISVAIKKGKPSKGIRFYTKPQ